MSSMALSFARFVAETRNADVPAEALEVARTGCTDFAACIFLGLHDAVMPMIRGTLDTVAPGAAASLAFGVERASATEAALFNGAAAHASHMDDNALRNNHLSSVLAAALLAEGEASDASGAAMLASYAIGYEVWARLVAAEKDGYAPRGWHATAMLGPIAAAAAVSHLKGLSAEPATAAICAAASLSGGTSGNFNDYVKPYQVGRAAASGITAVRLAMAGFQYSAGALDASNGLLAALSPKGQWDAQAPLADFGSTWRIGSEGINLKRYPMALPVHRALDGIFELVAAHGFSASEVQGIEVEVGEAEFKVLQPRLGTPEAFKPLISVELALAAALIAGEITARQMQRDFHQQPAVRALMGKVQTRVRSDFPAERDPNLAYRSQLTVRLHDGRVLTSGLNAVPRGNWSARLSRDELWGKFRSCAVPSLQPDAARKLFEQLQSLERLASVRELALAARSA